MSFNVGDVVEFTTDYSDYAINTSLWVVVDKGSIGKVVKIFKTRIHVEGIEGKDVRVLTVPLDSDGGSYYLQKSDAEYVRPRQFGEVPDGGLSPSDPRLDWLWEDANALAKEWGLCSDYQNMVKALGIPGPIRSISVSREIDGFKVSRKYKARSKEEAEKMFEADFSNFSV
jgi:hypothetical protein